jgi:hypothetical protein
MIISESGKNMEMKWGWSHENDERALEIGLQASGK